MLYSRVGIKDGPFLFVAAVAVRICPQHPQPPKQVINSTMIIRICTVLAVLFVNLCQCNARYRKDGNPSSRSIVVQNRAGCKIDFFWIHPQTKELAGSNTDGGIVNGGDSTISSYVTHSFEVQELPSKKTGKCREEECRKAYFSVSANEDQSKSSPSSHSTTLAFKPPSGLLIYSLFALVFIVDENFVITVEDHKTRARRKAKEALEICKQSVEDDTSLTAEDKIDQLTGCMEQQLALSMQETADEIQFQSDLRKRMGNSWSEYACRDAMNTTTTNSIVNATWTFQPTRGKKQTFKTKLLFESDFSKIQRVEQFVTDQECQALLKAATPAKNPTSLPLKSKASSKVVGVFIEKIEQLASFVTGMSAKIEKEPLLQVRLIEPSTDKTTKQEDCSIELDGSTTCSGGTEDAIGPTVRVLLANDTNVLVSVMVMCETPEVGGEIFFTKTGTTLLPQDIKGDAIVILHEVNEKREEDPFVDEFVICPVQEGRMFTFSEEMAK